MAAALRLTGGRDVTPTSDVVEDEEARLALNKARKKRERFNFNMVGIKPGTELQFHYGPISHEEEPITAEVHFAQQNHLRGPRGTSLSAAATSIMQRHDVAWTAKMVAGSVVLVLRG